MMLLAMALFLLASSFALPGAQGVSGDEDKGLKERTGSQEALGSGIDPERYKTACPDYNRYAVIAQYVLEPLQVEYRPSNADFD